MKILMRNAICIQGKKIFSEKKIISHFVNVQQEINEYILITNYTKHKIRHKIIKSEIYIFHYVHMLSLK
jgi:methionine aminopeptidase